jgi:ribosomal protein S18 acetylase RimI-like enzyme
VAILENSGIVGFILAREIDWMNGIKKSIWLEYIAVTPEHRRQSVELELLTEVRNYAQNHDIDTLFTHLNTDNEPSNALLTKAGFSVKDWRIAFLRTCNGNLEQSKNSISKTVTLARGQNRCDI